MLISDLVKEFIATVVNYSYDQGVACGCGLGVVSAGPWWGKSQLLGCLVADDCSQLAWKGA